MPTCEQSERLAALRDQLDDLSVDWPPVPKVPDTDTQTTDDLLDVTASSAVVRCPSCDQVMRRGASSHLKNTRPLEPRQGAHLGLLPAQDAAKGHLRSRCPLPWRRKAALTAFSSGRSLATLVRVLQEAH